ncbi:MAG: hypothetical protein VKJ27_02770 [Synechocystis sp.]|nr:hypothetical protein [Synechocystis sp.]
MYRSLLLLCVWTAIAVGLRSWNLDAKPPWTDEFATLVFSLGRSFDNVPLGQPLPIEGLLQVLQPLDTAAPQQVIDRILDRDNHPPVYFVLAHLWYRLFPDNGGYLAIAVGRSLPVIFGSLLVPMGYGGVKWVWGVKAERLAHWVALAMAVSPYGVFISQEARHYTLALVWGLLSLACCLKSAQYWQRGQRLPLALSGAWILVNGLGISTHFLITLLLLAEGLGLGVWGWGGWRRGKGSLLPGITSFVPVILGTIAVVAVWGWLIYQRDFGNGMTQWIQFDEMSWFGFLVGPPVQLLAAWITMVCLLPVESPQLPVVILSGLGMILYFWWLMPVIYRGVQSRLKTEESGETQLLIYIFGSLTVIYLAIAYGAGLDITRGARYSFNFWPVLMLIMGLGLAQGDRKNADSLAQRRTSPMTWHCSLARSRQGLLLPAIFLTVGILSGVTITHNLGYQKYYRPDHFLRQLSKTPTADIRWIVSPHQSLVQTGELLGIALEAQRHFPALAPQLRFLLLPADHNRDPAVAEQLQQHLDTQSAPLDLWVVNYPPAIALEQCQADQTPPQTIYGYGYQHFICPLFSPNISQTGDHPR